MGESAALRERDVLVLCYHAVSERWSADLTLAPAQLEAQLWYLLERGYRGATFHEAVTNPPAPRTVAITFDDGFGSVFKHARGVLLKLGLPATVFVVTDFVSLKGPMRWPGIDHWLGGADEAELTPLTWDELRELVAAGWEIGSHTCTHPHLTACDDTALERELRASRDQCEEHLHRACNSLAYPYGDWNERVMKAASNAGFVTACTLPQRLHPSLPLAWPRVGIWRNDSELLFRLKVASRTRRLQGTPAWTLTQAMRHSFVRRVP